jgi:hypothetical protein
MYRDIENAYETPTDTISHKWSADILAQVKDENILSLFSYEFPSASFSDNIFDNSFDFLNEEQNLKTKGEVEAAFISCRAYKWLIQTLRNAEGYELYFGTLTAELHNILVSDPMPYRKEVEDLLANLLT